MVYCAQFKEWKTDMQKKKKDWLWLKYKRNAMSIKNGYLGLSEHVKKEILPGYGKKYYHIN